VTPKTVFTVGFSALAVVVLAVLVVKTRCALTLTGTITVFFLVVFMLVFGGGLLRRLLELVPTEHREHYERVMKKMYHATGGYLSGLTLICTINATLATTMLAVLGMPFFLPLGILSGDLAWAWIVKGFTAGL
jgi:predicted PurR-regulated permease PerM